jgi:hypothetical protein
MPLKRIYRRFTSLIFFLQLGCLLLLTTCKASVPGAEFVMFFPAAAPKKPPLTSIAANQNLFLLTGCITMDVTSPASFDAISCRFDYVHLYLILLLERGKCVHKKLLRTLPNYCTNSYWLSTVVYDSPLPSKSVTGEPNHISWQHQMKLVE